MDKTCVFGNFGESEMMWLGGMFLRAGNQGRGGDSGGISFNTQRGHTP